MHGRIHSPVFSSQSSATRASSRRRRCPAPRDRSPSPEKNSPAHSIFFLTLFLVASIHSLTAAFESQKKRENRKLWQRKRQPKKRLRNLQRRPQRRSKQSAVGNAQGERIRVPPGAFGQCLCGVGAHRHSRSICDNRFMTRRRWIADTWDEATATLKGEQAAHLIRVLRARPGMEYDIVAGDRVCHAVIAGITGDTVRFNLVADVPSEPALPVGLLLAIFKFDRMEWAIEKATELGVGRIIPVIARRTEKHLAQAASKRTERWRRIAREAAQQSRRSDVPVIEEAISLR